MKTPAQNASTSLPGGPGLRSRKKAKRRDDILSHAKRLFEQNGIEATTMADIADAVGVSPPTVFNYFGTKDGILIALITEGSNRSRKARALIEARADTDFCTIVVDHLAEISRATLRIADKRVWRYSEAATIRHPHTQLAQHYAENDAELCAYFGAFFARYVPEYRTDDPPGPDFVGRLFFDVWTGAFFNLIKDDDMTIETHMDELRDRVLPLCRMIYTDAFLARPVLQGAGG